MVFRYEYGLCQCGCGGKVSIANQTNRKRKWVRGEPVRFLNGHSMRTRKGKNAPNWKGGRRKSRRGRIEVLDPTHPNSNSRGYVMDYVLIAAKALGKPLPRGAVVHHHTDDELVICENQSYHMLLHSRIRAYRECGKAHFRKCTHCRQYDSPDNLYWNPASRASVHRKCSTNYNREWRVRHGNRNASSQERAN